MNYQIETMQQEDWPQVNAIHAAGIATGLASFAEDAPEWESWHRDYLTHCRLVARKGEHVLGWAALSAVSSN